MRRGPLAAALIVLTAAAASAQQPAPPPVDHSGHEMPRREPPPPSDDHAAHQPPAPLPPFVPPVTDEMRRAAFPEVMGHSVHDHAINAFALFDQLEWAGGNGAAAATWDFKGWVGGDRHRLWARSEGERHRRAFARAEAQVFYGQAISRWWNLLGGVRQDLGPGPSRSWLAVGLQGLAPYWFQVEATAYVGDAGRTHLRLETEYELLLTNRLILQPLVEVDLYGKADDARGLGAGLGSADIGLRLRYEFKRELAPYVGVTWDRLFFGTAERARAAGEPTARARVVAGLRVWY